MRPANKEENKPPLGGLFLFYLTSCTYQKKSYNGDNESGLYYLQSRYYDPNIGRFINADAFASTGQDLVGNNMFAYCLNNPIVFQDASGTYCAFAGSHLDEIARKQYYETADEAALAFFEEVYASSMYIRHEYGAEIYSIVIGGKLMYAYTTPRVGEPHGVYVYRSVPKGANYVAFAHTHPNSDIFSKGDRWIANKYLGNAYVAGPSGVIKKKIFLYYKTEDVGTFVPMPLTDYQRTKLEETYADAWVAHTKEGCGFDCSEKIWPTQ